MIQTYKFFGENSSLEFDDSKTVKELLQYAFEQFDYYEPFGMDIVTIYQSGHAHFTLDTSRKCYEEIEFSGQFYTTIPEIGNRRSDMKETEIPF